MRFVYYDDLESGESACFGLEVFGVIYNLAETLRTVAALAGLPEPPIPATPWAYHALAAQEKAQLAAVLDQLNTLAPEARSGLIRQQVRRLPPVPRPASLRCFSVFEGHTKLLRRRRGLAMPVEWYEAPAFFFGNHNAVYGPGAAIPQPASFWLDYEIQIACVIGKAGRNIRVEEADEYIAGYTIMGDWCARDLEMYEMRMGVSPFKGRDFAISLGPALVTPDELAAYAVGEGNRRRYDLRMEARINERNLSGLWTNARAMHFSFAQMIEHASADATLQPGDVLASGAADGGSLLAVGAEETLGRWLQPGDVVDLEVDGLGVLRSTIGPPQM